MRSLRRVAAVATLLALSSALTACGGDDDKDSDSDDTVTETVTAPSETPTSEATTTAPTETTSVTPMDPTGETITQEQVDAALLTPEEVGADFALGAYSDDDDPLPCDPSGTPLDTAFPPSVQSGIRFDHSSGQIVMQEEISIYASEDAAAQAFAAGTAGLTCTDGTLPDGSTVTIDPPQDLTAQVNASGLGTSTGWTFAGDGFEGGIIVTLAGRVLLASTFQAAPDADTSTVANPVDIQAAAFAKALAN